mgnify:CR=1 FL=1
MRRASRAGISEVVSTAILLAITISLGIFVWGLSTGWSFVSSLEYTQETDEAVAQLQSMINVELSYMEPGKCILYIRNIGKTDVEITKVDIRPEGEQTWDHVTFTDLRIIRDTVRKVEVVSSYCNPSSGKAVKLIIHYTAERIADNPGKYLRLPHLVAPETLSLSGYTISEWCPIGTIPRLLYLSSGKEDWDLDGRNGFILFSGMLSFNAKAGSGSVRLRLGNGSTLTVNFDKQTFIYIKFDHDSRRYPTDGLVSVLKSEKTVSIREMHVKYISIQKAGETEQIIHDAMIESLNAELRDWGSTDLNFNFEFHGGWLDVNQPTDSNLPSGEDGSWHLYIVYEKGTDKDIDFHMSFSSGGVTLDFGIQHGRGLLIGCV